MTDIEILKEMINSKAIGHVTQEGDVFLEEHHKGNKIPHKAKITGIPKDIFVFKSDSFEEFVSIFDCNEERGFCCRADYIIIADDNGNKQILYVELKGGKPKNIDKRHVTDQLKGSECLIAYCKKIGSAFWDEADNFLKGYVPHYVLIVKGVRRRTVTRKKHSSPEEPKVFQSGNGLKYKQLIG